MLVVSRLAMPMVNLVISDRKAYLKGPICGIALAGAIVGSFQTILDIHFARPVGFTISLAYIILGGWIGGIGEHRDP